MIFSFLFPPGNGLKKIKTIPVLTGEISRGFYEWD